jgi:excisionase family DNA binding protein
MTHQVNILAKEAHSPLYATRAQIAARYSISLRHLDYLIKDGIIPSVRLGKRCLRIPVSEADAYVKSLQTGRVTL